MSKTYPLFISHSWTYEEHYESLESRLNTRPGFYWRNYSVPKDDPIHNAPNKDLLYAAIRRQMAPCSVIIILAGVYSTYSTWIQREIQIANKEFANPKPILAIQTLGAQRISSVVSENANLIVKWHIESVIDGIKQLT